jgi:hypothetical protein
LLKVAARLRFGVRAREFCACKELAVASLTIDPEKLFVAEIEQIEDFRADSDR